MEVTWQPFFAAIQNGGQFYYFPLHLIIFAQLQLLCLLNNQRVIMTHVHYSKD